MSNHQQGNIHLLKLYLLKNNLNSRILNFNSNAHKIYFKKFKVNFKQSYNDLYYSKINQNDSRVPQSTLKIYFANYDNMHLLVRALCRIISIFCCVVVDSFILVFIKAYQIHATQ